MLSGLPEQRGSSVLTSIISEIRDRNCTPDGTCEEQPPSNECHGSGLCCVLLAAAVKQGGDKR